MWGASYIGLSEYKSRRVCPNISYDNHLVNFESTLKSHLKYANDWLSCY